MVFHDCLSVFFVCFIVVGGGGGGGGGVLWGFVFVCLFCFVAVHVSFSLDHVIGTHFLKHTHMRPPPHTPAPPTPPLSLSLSLTHTHSPQ